MECTGTYRKRYWKYAQELLIIAISRRHNCRRSAFPFVVFCIVSISFDNEHSLSLLTNKASQIILHCISNLCRAYDILVWQQTKIMLSDITQQKLIFKIKYTSVIYSKSTLLCILVSNVLVESLKILIVERETMHYSDGHTTAEVIFK